MKKILYLFLAFLPQLVSAQVNMNLGLRAYYPFSGNANDVSGNNNNPIFNNATLATDRFGTVNNAYEFNGTDNYMQIPNSASLNTNASISICAWVRVKGFYNGDCHGNSMLEKGNTETTPGSYFLRFDDHAYTNGQNCSTPLIDLSHHNFFGKGAPLPTGGYVPYIQSYAWYSVVYTNDGATARLYVNCILKASAPSNGLQYTNSDDLFLGKFNNAGFPNWFKGVLDEVRIYDRALTTDEVKTYSGCSLNTTVQTIGGVINSYTPVISIDRCNNKIEVENVGAFLPGDTAMLIQMKGAIIDSSNSDNFGEILNFRNTGKYEMNIVKATMGNIVEFKYTLLNQYDVPEGRVQLIRVPYYRSVIVTFPLTCSPWDGRSGGVLVLNAADTINIQAPVDVSGKGFRGGTGYNSNSGVLSCNNNDFFYPASSNSIAGQKGEGVAEISADKNYGKGPLGNGGGGGQGHNSGGGGGGNGGRGGYGGYQLDACGFVTGTPFPLDNRGIGGSLLRTAPVGSNTGNRPFMGGGGGAGQADNPGNIASGGGNGGGIIFIIADKVISNGNYLNADGLPGQACNIPPSTDCHDGMGGGGAGGSIFLSVNRFVDLNILTAKGGNGADMRGSVPLGGRVGPGGGGGGGQILYNTPVPSFNTFPGTPGGLTGRLPNGGGLFSWGAQDGNGQSTGGFDYVVTTGNEVFKLNIDSVRIKDSLLTCDSVDFKGLGYVNTNPVVGWEWEFGDGGTASTQNTNHLYAAGSYLVKLRITDINGCKDSITKNLSVVSVTADAGPATSICTPNSTILQATSSGATQYSWTPATSLNNPNILNPTATPAVTTMYYLTASKSSSCLKKDSVLVTVRAVNFNVNPSTVICPDSTAQLLASGGDQYLWQPASTLSNPTIANPVATPLTTTTYSVQITDLACNANSSLFTTITVNPSPQIRANKRNDIDCSTGEAQLIASGGSRYQWTPTATLDNPNSSAPIARPTVTTQYFVTGTDLYGCSNRDSIIVNVDSSANKPGYFMPSGFTPNNDGLNDCYRIKFWGPVEELEFSIYNRWGQRVFFTRNSNDCWDGRHRGKMEETGVFIYMIRAKAMCEQPVFRKGTFALIR